MSGWAALLRAVNVGGTGKLPMAELKALCEELGLGQVRTYIASGNVVFASDSDEAKLREMIGEALHNRYGKPFGVLVRSAKELAALVKHNHWPDQPGNRVFALLTDDKPSLDGVRHQTSEELRVGPRAIFTYYADGAGKSRLVIPAAKTGTARNMNTIAKLAEMTAAL